MPINVERGKLHLKRDIAFCPRYTHVLLYIQFSSISLLLLFPLYKFDQVDEEALDLFQQHYNKFHTNPGYLISYG